MSTSVVAHGMVATCPSLFLKFFHQFIFPCRHMCSSETLGTISTSLLVFVENVFTSFVSLLAMECKLHSGKFGPVFVITCRFKVHRNKRHLCMVNMALMPEKAKLCIHTHSAL